jgi:GT2 family glycosyltransferase
VNLIAVVLNWNGGEETVAALESLRGVETICVDNGSIDGSADLVEERFPEVELIRTGENLGFAGGNNVGIRRALPAALAAAVEQRPDAGVLACKVYFAEPPDVLMYAGGRVNLALGYWGRQDGFRTRDDGRFDTLRDVNRATGAAMAVSRAAVERAGLLDETFFLYAEDAEWCIRIRRAGFAVVFVPDAKAWHVGSASTGGLMSPASLYYDTRNMIVVAERHHRLPPGPRGIRRGVVVGAHLLAARTPAAARAVLAGWRDARRGRLGPR